MLLVARITIIVRPDFNKYDNNKYDKIIDDLFIISFKQLSLKDKNYKHFIE